MLGVVLGAAGSLFLYNRKDEILSKIRIKTAKAKDKAYSSVVGLLDKANIGSINVYAPKQSDFKHPALRSQGCLVLSIVVPFFLYFGYNSVAEIEDFIFEVEDLLDSGGQGVINSKNMNAMSDVAKDVYIGKLKDKFGSNPFEHSSILYLSYKGRGGSHFVSIHSIFGGKLVYDSNMDDGRLIDLGIWLPKGDSKGYTLKEVRSFPGFVDKKYKAVCTSNLPNPVSL